MTNHEKPKRLNAEANWTKFIDSQSEHRSESHAEECIGKMTHCDLTQGHLDDLEIDSMLRELAKSDQDESEFAARVLGKLELPNPHPVPRKKGRLPVPAPIFETEYDDTFENSNLATRLLNSRWITPKSLLVASSLTAAFAITFFARGFLAEPGSPAIADKGTHEIAAKNTNETEKVMGAGESELVAEHTTDDSEPYTGPNWIFEPSLFDSANPANTDLVSDHAQPRNEPELRPYKRWNFAIDFDEFGMGSMSVNGTNLPGIAFRDTSFPLLNSIGNAVKERFETLQPRLNTTVSGTISINGNDFRFGSPERIDRAVARATEFMAKLSVQPLPPNEMLKLRSKFIRDQEFKRFMASGNDQNNSPKVDFLDPFSSGTLATTDEAAAINSVVQVTEAFLRDWSNEMVRWEKASGLEAPQVANAKISENDFEAFRLQGKNLIVSTPRPTIRASKTLQKLNSEELRQQLFVNTRSLDIFTSARESIEAAREVRSNDQRGVSEKSERLSSQLVQIENKLQQFAKQNSTNEETRREISSLEDKYVEVADELEEFRRENGVEPLLDFLEERPSLKGLPLVMGDECHMEPEQARAMNQVSKSVGRTLSQFDRFATRDARQNDSWRFNMVRNSMVQHSRNYTDENALVTLDQMLQIDHPRVRVELVKALSNSESDKSIELLTRRAKFDLMPEVRMAATEALMEMKPEDYRQYLLEGFEYPWTAVAQHSAEALVRLDDQGALDSLVALLKAPAPNLPQRTDNGKYVMREVVAINHMKNCFLCHAPSTGNSDRGRAVVPTWNEPLPRMYYNQPGGGSFVRADTTYLRQDFSVMQTVEDPGPWPKVQRFDYVIYNNEISNNEARDYFRDHQNDENLHRKAILFALRELTGRNPSDDSHATWVAEVAKFKKSSRAK